MKVTFITSPEERSEICRAILSCLPEWFGRPDSIDAYVNISARLPTFACLSNGTAVGFASVKSETTETIDIHVMGVKREAQGEGIGRALVEACEAHGRNVGARFLTVKTIGTSSPDPYYKLTREFYRSCGMAEIVEFPDYWGVKTPMLLLGKSLVE